MTTKEKFLTNRLVVFLIMLFLCIIWGSAYPIVKIGYDMFQIDKSHVPSIMMFAGIRYVATGLLLLIPGIIMSPKSFILNRAKQGCVLINTAFQVVGQYYFYFIGLARTPGTRAAIINSTTVFIAIFLAAFLFRTEKYDIAKLVASIMAVASMVVLNHVDGFGFSFSLTAEGFILVSSFLTAIATCLQKPLVGKTGVMPLCSYSFLLGGLLFLAYAFAFGGKIAIGGFNAYALLAYVSLVSAFGFSVQALLLEYNDVSVISIYRIMLPISGVILSAVMLKEYDILFRLNTLVSLLLMVGAMLLLGAGRRKKSDSGFSTE
ncbi:MAG TPA: hypothetical protein DCO86_04965 [Spirochaetaceae bacterium]|nr:hypothetical protein [Spirochaetaceae bacterium]